GSENRTCPYRQYTFSEIPLLHHGKNLSCCLLIWQFPGQMGENYFQSIPLRLLFWLNVGHIRLSHKPCSCLAAPFSKLFFLFLSLFPGILVRIIRDPVLIQIKICPSCIFIKNIQGTSI